MVPAKGQEAFIRQLALDGFTLREGELIRALPADLELPQSEDEVSRLLNQFGFVVPKGHLDQALTAHGRGDWAAANGQLRSFYEGLFEAIAHKLSPTKAAALASSDERRQMLVKEGFLREDLNEWGAGSKNFVNSLFKRLHPEGSHPGLSDEHDSTFRRHIVLISARLFLTRLEASFP